MSNTIFRLFGEIAIRNDKANKAISNTNSMASKLQKGMQTAFTNVGKAAVTCGKVVASGLAVGAAAMGALMKATIGEYANYEQLVGGVETLFGAGGKSLEEYAESVGKSVEEASGEYEKLMAAQDAVFKNANKAHKTAGLSANAYMETVTSFSASLINSLGGDTAAAAEMANIAIEDMADNANTFGMDITRIQDAYKNFARGQFQLLDNLSLGYNGSQEEMARLINDSGVMGKNFIATAENVKDISFAKIIEAIHVVQTEMGIAGKTSEEASKTISGSFSTFKATWSNLLTGLANEENIEPLIDTFFEAGQTVLRNVGKVIPKIKDNVVDAVRHIGVKVREGMSQTVWPAIQKFAKIHIGIDLPDWETIEGQVSAWAESTLKPALENAKTFFTDIQAGLQSVYNWITENQGVVNAFFVGIAGALLIMNAPIALLIAALALVAANWETIKTAVTNAIAAVGTFFTQTIPQAWKDFITEIQTWIDNNIVAPIQTAINKIKEFLGINDSKTVTVTYKTRIEQTADAIGAGVTESTGSSFLGELARLNSITFTKNPDAPWMPTWNADGAIFRKPTIFNTRLGLQGVGEAGPEAVAPIGALQGYVSSAVRSEMSRMDAAIDRLAGIMQQVAANTAAGTTITMDGRVVAGQIATHIDAALGTLTNRKGRRN